MHTDRLKNNQVDTLIHARWIVPVVPQQQVYTDCSLAIKDGQIVDLLPTGEARSRYEAEQEFELPDHAVLPGLINTHTHTPMSLLRGYADDLPLMTWLEEHIWPAEQKWVDEDFAADGSLLAIAEMLRSGTTTFADQYFHPESTAAVARDTGIRTQLAFPILDFPTPWSQSADEALEKGLALRDDVKQHPRIGVVFAPHAPYTVGDATLQKIAVYAAELQMPIQMHLHETACEVERAVAETGERPTQRLQRLGLLTPQTLCVHMTALNEEDIALLQQSGAHVAHCPKSNLKLASGFCPTAALLDAGVNVALGTDGAASNNNLDLFAEANQAALLAKAVSGRAEAVPAFQALEMATINGARALGLDGDVGSLEVGKQADVIAIDMSALEKQPMHDPVSQLIYTPSGHSVTHSWVAGRTLMQDRELLSINVPELRQRTRQWRDRIAGQ